MTARTVAWLKAQFQERDPQDWVDDLLDTVAAPQDTVAFAGAVTVGTTLDVTGASTVGGTLGVTGASNLAGNHTENIIA